VLSVAEAGLPFDLVDSLAERFVLRFEFVEP
jgi:hypothetical protein